jgi:hypothetical protein
MVFRRDIQKVLCLTPPGVGLRPRGAELPAPPRPARGRPSDQPRGPGPARSAKDAKLAQNWGQLQPFIAVFQQECILGQFVYVGPT